MDIASFLVQALNGLASASSLFMVAAGLSLIFGVTRIVNFAHGSFFMLGVYVAYALVSHAAPFVSAALGVLLPDAVSQTVAYFLLLLCAALVTGVLGAVVFLLLEETLSHFTIHWQLGLGALLLLVVLVWLLVLLLIQVILHPTSLSPPLRVQQLVHGNF
jgi:branched-chain amino acid transport system permease protein